MSRGNAQEVADRHLEIVRYWLRTRNKSATARKFEVDVRTVDLAITRWRETRPTLTRRNPVEVIEDWLAEMDELTEQLAEIAANAAHDSVKVGAIKGRVALMAEKRALLTEVGALPQDLGVLARQLELGAIAERVKAVLDEHDASPEFKRDLLSAFRGEALEAAA